MIAMRLTMSLLLSGSSVICFKNHSLWVNFYIDCPDFLKPCHILIYYSVNFCLYHSIEFAFAKITDGHSDHNFYETLFSAIYMILYCTHFASCFLMTCQSSHSFNSNYLFIFLSFSIGPHLFSFDTSSVL